MHGFGHQVSLLDETASRTCLRHRFQISRSTRPAVYTLAGRPDVASNMDCPFLSVKRACAVFPRADASSQGCEVCGVNTLLRVAGMPDLLGMRNLDQGLCCLEVLASAFDVHGV